MSQSTCVRCDRKLYGVRELRFVLGRLFLAVLVVDSADCNWRTCPTCGKAFCKSCYVKTRPPAGFPSTNGAAEVASPPGNVYAVRNLHPGRPDPGPKNQHKNSL
jgi:hypothetical protein